ncbi:hypothetical protein GN244_ATG07503 [Phytophthora infestans]|uniref:Uncharacterized protein n=1 Tax=Phytophthora infestans TaxID=4787 RepID=A0A833WFH6_PHYIN|nr:hypothetical protein GN244_ATG07503 [Phytophthora infestans]
MRRAVECLTSEGGASERGVRAEKTYEERSRPRAKRSVVSTAEWQSYGVEGCRKKVEYAKVIMNVVLISLAEPHCCLFDLASRATTHERPRNEKDVTMAAKRYLHADSVAIQDEEKDDTSFSEYFSYNDKGDSEKNTNAESSKVLTCMEGVLSGKAPTAVYTGMLMD